MSFIRELLSGGGSELVNPVGNVLDNLDASKEEKLQLELELRKAEKQYEIDMKKLGVQEEELVYNDIKNARIMNSEIQVIPNSSKLSRNGSAYLAIGTIILTFVLFYIILLYQIK